MGVEKNITIRQFNGVDYDTLYPKTIASQIPDVYSKTDTITAETLSQLGLSADKLPNDAFQKIKTLIDGVQSSVDGKHNIQTGSYVGTGTSGSANPCSLTFDFKPKFIGIFKLVTDAQNFSIMNTLDWFVYPSNASACTDGYRLDSYPFCRFVTWGDNYVSWYVYGNGANITAENQRNILGETYYYIAL